MRKELEHNMKYEGKHLISEFKESGLRNNHIFLVCSCGAYLDKGEVNNAKN